MRILKMFLTSLNTASDTATITLLLCTLFVIPDTHAVNGNPTLEPFPAGMETIMFGKSCCNMQISQCNVIGVPAFKRTCHVCFHRRYGMLLGSRATLLAPSRCLLYASRLRWRLHTEPQLSRGLLRYGPLNIDVF